MIAIITRMRYVLRGIFLALLILGLSFWRGLLLPLIPLHMGLGILFVLGLWTLGVASLFRGVARWRSVRVILLGLVVLIVGVAQLRLPSTWHVIQVAHLLLGLVAFWQADGLAKALRARAVSPAVPSDLESQAAALR